MSLTRHKKIDTTVESLVQRIERKTEWKEDKFLSEIRAPDKNLQPDQTGAQNH